MKFPYNDDDQIIQGVARRKITVFKTVMIAPCLYISSDGKKPLPANKTFELEAWGVITAK